MVTHVVAKLVNTIGLLVFDNYIPANSDTGWCGTWEVVITVITIKALGLDLQLLPE